MKNTPYRKYIEEKEKILMKIIEKIENNDIVLNELDDDLIDNLICYYTQQIAKKRKKISDIEYKIKKG